MTMDNSINQIEEPSDVYEFTSFSTVENNLLGGLLVESKDGYFCLPLDETLSTNINLANLQYQILTQQNTSSFITLSTLDSSEVELSSGTTTVLPSGLDTNESNSLSLLNDSGNEISTMSLSSLQASLEDNVVTCLLPVIEETEEEKHSEEDKTDDVKPSSSGTQSSVQNVKNSSMVQNRAMNTPFIPHLTLANLTKRRGGWPKGRKRKPELLNLPPKAPATGYTLFLNERRQFYKERSLAFHEITKLVGNEWSNLSLNEKKPYLARAEEEKKRYREELRIYRQSEAYRTYLARKRKKRVQYNILSESDMDATDEVDDEDNEELYCRTCDQWFHSLHNKREHLLGRQHSQLVAGDMTRELAIAEQQERNTAAVSTAATTTATTITSSASLDDSSIDGTSGSGGVDANDGEDVQCSSVVVADAMEMLMAAVSTRENEISSLRKSVNKMAAKNNSLLQEMNVLTTRENRLKEELLTLKEDEKLIEEQLFQLWSVPSMFIITNLDTLHSATPESSEYSLSDILPE